MKIAIVRLDHLGDLILCTPLMRALSQARHEVDLILPDAFLPVFQGHPRLHAVYPISEAAPKGFPGDWRGLARWLRRGRYDCILLPYGQEKRLLWASMLTGLPPRRRLAMWAGLWGRLTFHTCLRSRTYEEPRPFADVLLDLAKKLGVEPRGLQPEIVVPATAVAWAAEELNTRFPGAAGRIIGIHPGCAGNTCNLPPGVYGELAARLLKRGDGTRLVITGTAGERPLLEAFPREVLDSPHVWNTVGELRLEQLAALIQKMDAYVVPSTGPLHIAAALGTTTLSPFCPLPPKCALIWGNQGASGHVLEPESGGCDEVHKRPECRSLCDFRGTITATMLEERLNEV